MIKKPRNNFYGMNILRTILFLCLFSLFFNCIAQNNELKKYNRIPIALVPASFPVNFALMSSGNFQFVAFYDTAHRMVIAKRKLNKKKWDYQSLDSKIPWDTHNYLSLALDKNGIIHLSGNMHSSPLIYFRSSKPFDIHSMQKVDKMTGKEEDITTYPEFITNSAGDLIFHYRYGRSGSGYEVYKKWDVGKAEWKRLLDKPLTDGEGKMNAYMQGPLSGPDGNYHLLWVWRDSPDCATNHTLSYARSKDLLNWESIDGKKLNLPITIESTETYVDTTQIYGGLINIGIKIGFDQSGKTLPGYLKYDSIGNTQLFAARFENGNWKSYQLSNWNYRWDFKGMGSIRHEIEIEPIRPAKNKNELIFAYHHIKYGDGQVVVDNSTLKPLRTEKFMATYPSAIDSLQMKYPGVQVNKAFDKGKPANDKKYLLRWETLPPNRDQLPENTDIEPALLELIEY